MPAVFLCFVLIGLARLLKGLPANNTAAAAVIAIVFKTELLFTVDFMSVAF
jgi:hypothetical protein